MPKTAVIVHLGTGTQVSNPPKAPSRGCTLVEHYNAIVADGGVLHISDGAQSTQNSFIPILDLLRGRGRVASYDGAAGGAASAADDTSVDESSRVTKAILDGPDLLATKVYQKCAESILLTLVQIARGYTDVVFTAHSRGAIISFVTAVFIEEVIDSIKSEDAAAGIHDLLTVEKPSDEDTIKRIKQIFRDKLTKESLTTLDAGLKAHIRAGLALEQQQSPQLSILALDPVPGGFNGFKSGWHTSAPEKVGRLKWLKFMEVIYAEHEASYAFAAHMVFGDPEKVKTLTLPGHHGTAQGKYGTQQDGAYLATLGTGLEIKDFSPLVQEIVLLKLLAFTKFDRAHISFNPDLVSAKLPGDEAQAWKGKLSRTLKTVVSDFNSNPNHENYQKTILELYDRLQTTREYFNIFRDSTYLACGSLPHLAISPYFYLTNFFASRVTQLVVAGDRLVITGASDADGYKYSSLLTRMDVHREFINSEHLELKTKCLHSDLSISTEYSTLLQTTGFSDVDKKCITICGLIKSLLGIKGDSGKENLRNQLLKNHISEIIALLDNTSLHEIAKEKALLIINEVLLSSELKEIAHDAIAAYYHNKILSEAPFDDMGDAAEADDSSENIFKDFQVLFEQLQQYHRLIRIIKDLEVNRQLFKIKSGANLITEEQYHEIIAEFIKTKYAILANLNKQTKILNALKQDRILTVLKDSVLEVIKTVPSDESSSVAGSSPVSSRTSSPEVARGPEEGEDGCAEHTILPMVPPLPLARLARSSSSSDDSSLSKEENQKLESSLKQQLEYMSEVLKIIECTGDMQYVQGAKESQATSSASSSPSTSTSCGGGGGGAGAGAGSASAIATADSRQDTSLLKYFEWLALYRGYREEKLQQQTTKLKYDVQKSDKLVKQKTVAIRKLKYKAGKAVIKATVRAKIAEYRVKKLKRAKSIEKKRADTTSRALDIAMHIIKSASLKNERLERARITDMIDAKARAAVTAEDAAQTLDSERARADEAERRLEMLRAQLETKTASFSQKVITIMQVVAGVVSIGSGIFLLAINFNVLNAMNAAFMAGVYFTKNIAVNSNVLSKLISSIPGNLITESPIFMCISGISIAGITVISLLQALILSLTVAPIITSGIKSIVRFGYDRTRNTDTTEPDVDSDVDSIDVLRV